MTTNIKFKKIRGGSFAAFRYMSRYDDGTFSFAAEIPEDASPFWDKFEKYVIMIPKTATISIQQYINPKCDFGHLYGREFPVRIRDKLLTIVRNPYDRLVSAYFFMIRGGFNQNPEYLRIKTDYTDFGDWVLRGLKKPLFDQVGFNGWREAFLPQTFWLLDHNQELVIDMKNIGRYENLVEDVKRLMGISLQLHCNKSADRDPDWKSYYQNRAVREKVYSFYQKDFEVLGYEKIAEV
jgi:hypothetical protein